MNRFHPKDYKKPDFKKKKSKWKIEITKTKYEEN